MYELLNGSSDQISMEELSLLTKDVVEKFVEKYGYPLYIYDAKNINQKINDIKSCFAEYNLIYSVKANPFESIMRLMLDRDVGVDAASKNEVLIPSDIGFNSDNIYYSSPGKSFFDIEKTITKCTIIADSFYEIEKINQVANKIGIVSPIGVRLNICNELILKSKYEIMCGKTSKFGIDLDLFLKNINKLNAYKNINIAGIHVYFGSQILDETIISNNFKITAETCLMLKDCFDIAFVNFGGGFGIPYKDDEEPLDLLKIQSLNSQSKSIKELLSSNIKCNIELGRYLVAECGLYITKVEDIKESFGEKYAILQGGMNSFFRPVFTKQNHNIVQYTIRKQKEIINIVGNLCTPIDEYFNKTSLNELAIGDIVSFENAGAYGYSMSLLEFISYDKPVQIIYGGEINDRNR